MQPYGGVREEIQEPTPEPTLEPTPEPTPVVYEGIDMESDLPGKEWMGTFVGIIEEANFVVFNDETNKKVIVENNQEIDYSPGDTIAVYVPKDCLAGGYDYQGQGVKIDGLQIDGSNSPYCAEIILTRTGSINNNVISIDIYDKKMERQVIKCTLKAAKPST